MSTSGGFSGPSSSSPPALALFCTSGGATEPLQQSVLFSQIPHSLQVWLCSARRLLGASAAAETRQVCRRRHSSIASRRVHALGRPCVPARPWTSGDARPTRRSAHRFAWRSSRRMGNLLPMLIGTAWAGNPPILQFLAFAFMMRRWCCSPCVVDSPRPCYG